MPHGYAIFGFFGYSGLAWHSEDQSVVRTLQSVWSFVTKTVGCKCRIGA